MKCRRDWRTEKRQEAFDHIEFVPVGVMMTLITWWLMSTSECWIGHLTPECWIGQMKKKPLNTTSNTFFAALWKIIHRLWPFHHFLLWFMVIFHEINVDLSLKYSIVMIYIFLISGIVESARHLLRNAIHATIGSCEASLLKYRSIICKTSITVMET